MFCPQCGKPLKEGAKFCPYCGKAVPGPKKNKHRILYIILACAAIVAVGLGGFLLGRLSSSPGTQENQGTRRTGEKTAAASESGTQGNEMSVPVSESGTESGHGGDAGKAPDPRAVALAVAEKEWQKMLDSITPDSLDLFISGDQEILQLVMNYKEAAESARPQIRLYAFGSQKGAKLPENMDIPQLLSMAVMRHINTYGARMITASTVIPRLSADNSYPYPWNAADLPFYAAETLIDGETLAITFIGFNDYHALTASTIPLPGAVGSEFDFTSLLSLLKTEYAISGKQEDTSFVETSGILDRLVPTVSSEKSAEEMALILAAIIRSRANADYLALLKTPADVTAYCQQCRAFFGQPSRIVRFVSLDLSDETVSSMYGSSDLSKEELDYLHNFVSSQQGSLLNSMMSSSATAAGGLMSASLAVSGLREEDTVLWLCYEADDQPFVLAVSIRKNVNGCYDLKAEPVFAWEIAENVLKYAENDTLTVEDLIRGVYDMSGR